MSCSFLCQVGVKATIAEAYYNLQSSGGFQKWWPCKRNHGGPAHRPTTGVLMVRMPEFLLHAATFGLIVLEVEFRVKGIVKQDLRFTI